jgi:hypothetical protein
VNKGIESIIKNSPVKIAHGIMGELFQIFKELMSIHLKFF